MVRQRLSVECCVSSEGLTLGRIVMAFQFVCGVTVIIGERGGYPSRVLCPERVEFILVGGHLRTRVRVAREVAWTLAGE